MKKGICIACEKEKELYQEGQCHSCDFIAMKVTTAIKYFKETIK